MTEIKIGKTYKVGRARYRVIRVENGAVRVHSAGYSLTFPQERFARMIECGAAAQTSAPPTSSKKSSMKGRLPCRAPPAQSAKSPPPSWA